jgi:hypothetical protein
MTKTKFIEFWMDLFINPKEFFEKNLANSTVQPAFFVLAMIIFGVGYGIDRIDNQLLKFDLKGKLHEIEVLNNWLIYWVAAIVFGIIGGYILYLIGGWFFNVRLKWSKGTGDIDKSRYIYLYSGVVSSSTIILISLGSMLFADKPYDSEAEFNLWDLISLLFLIFMVYYSVIVSYTGVQTITDADVFRSRIWFLILPFVIYTTAFITIFGLIFNYVT